MQDPNKFKHIFKNVINEDEVTSAQYILPYSIRVTKILNDCCHDTLIKRMMIDPFGHYKLLWLHNIHKHRSHYHY